MSDGDKPAAIKTDDTSEAGPAEVAGAPPVPPPLQISVPDSPNNDRRVGEVIRIVSRKFGFIKLDNEPNIFFHFKDLPEDAMGGIAVNTKVEFTMVENPWEKGKMKAVAIVVLEKGESVTERRSRPKDGASGGSKENSWASKYGTWRKLFEALSSAITNVDERTDALKEFVSATQFSAQEDGVSLLRSIQVQVVCFIGEINSTYGFTESPFSLPLIPLLLHTPLSACRQAWSHQAGKCTDLPDCERHRGFPKACRGEVGYWRLGQRGKRCAEGHGIHHLEAQRGASAERVSPVDDVLYPHGLLLHPRCNLGA
jgi:cold shock CspA family protein